MSALQLELALSELFDLAAEPQPEAAYQSWFERHEMVLNLVGYERVIPHPLLRQRKADGDIEDYCPDFMGQRASGLWEILEIKRPDTAVLKAPTRRQQFYAEFGRYVSQCREYSKYFEDSANRAFFEATYATRVQSQVKAHLLAGRNDGMDRFRVNELIAENRALEFETYDELFARLANIWHAMEGEREGLSGYSFFARLIVKTGATDIDLWIADIGMREDRSRVALYTRGTMLHVDVYDDDGHVHEMRVPIAEAMSKSMYLGFEFGVADSFVSGRVWVNDRAAATRWAPFRFTTQQVISHVVGSDMVGVGQSNFYLGEIAVFGGIPNLMERIKMRAYMMNPERDPTQWLHFTGGAFMYNAGHPTFAPRVVEYGGLRLLVPNPVQGKDLMQQNESRGPRIVADPFVDMAKGEAPV